MSMQSLTQRLQAVNDHKEKYNLYLLFQALFEQLRSQSNSSAGLTGTAVTTPSTGGSVYHYVAQGIKRRIAASTAMPALVGTVSNGAFNVFVFSVDSAGTTYSQMGVESATEAGIKWPNLAPGRAVIGYIVVNPTGTGDFIGGTTTLNNATVVPNTVFINVIGAFDPNISIPAQ